MKDQRSYFETADFQSALPYQFLAGAVGLCLVFIEVGMAQMPVFYGASPLLSWIFVYYIRLYHVSLLPVGTVFLIGLIGDLLLSDVLGGRATAMILAIYVTDARRARLEQYDFGSLWFDFVIFTAGILIFQLFFFSIINLAIPSLSAILFQLGVTIILFPISFFLITLSHRLLQRLGLAS